MRWWMWAGALAVAACGGDDLRIENADGDAVDAIVVVPNLDDDDEDGEADEAGTASDEERVPFTIPSKSFKGGEPRLRLVAPDGGVRVWYDGNVALENDGDEMDIPQGDDLNLQIEGLAPGVGAGLELVRIKGGEEDVRRVPIRVAPMLLDHHLQPAERVFLMNVKDYGDTYQNQAMVQLYRDVFGDAVEFVGDARHDYDVWVQDEMQLGSLTDETRAHHFVLNSIRTDAGGLDRLPSGLFGPDWPEQTYGRGLATTYDSFGNLEVSPPVTVGEVDYPFGRIYLGNHPRGEMHPKVREFLADQKVQAPLEFDTTWLCVGHIDEFMSFVPDPDSEKGFKYLIADTALGYELLEAEDPNMSLPRYRPRSPELGHGRATLNDILSDGALRSLNEEVQRDHIDPILNTMKAEFGLTDADIIKVPVIFEEAYFCGGAVVAMTPGMVNLVVAEREGATQVILADPFLRTDEDAQGDDPYIRYMRENLPSSLQLHFADDWFVYHMGMGEVHCATNVQRTAAGSWWETALHLLSDPFEVTP